MGRPQQPELARRAKTDVDPDHVETGLQGQKAPPAAERDQESILTALALLPLRETVKRLEQLERKLTERLEGTRRRVRGSGRR